MENDDRAETGLTLEDECAALRLLLAREKAAAIEAGQLLQALSQELQELRDRVLALTAHQAIAHCGCELRHEKPENLHGGWYELGDYDGEPRQWLRACELHRRYGFHREMEGLDEGLSK